MYKDIITKVVKDISNLYDKGMTTLLFNIDHLFVDYRGGYKIVTGYFMSTKNWTLPAYAHGNVFVDCNHYAFKTLGQNDFENIHASSLVLQTLALIGGIKKE